MSYQDRKLVCLDGEVFRISFPPDKLILVEVFKDGAFVSAGNYPKSLLIDLLDAPTLSPKEAESFSEV